MIAVSRPHALLCLLLAAGCDGSVTDGVSQEESPAPSLPSARAPTPAALAQFDGVLTAARADFARHLDSLPRDERDRILGHLASEGRSPDEIEGAWSIDGVLDSFGGPTFILHPSTLLPGGPPYSAAGVADAFVLAHGDLLGTTADPAAELRLREVETDRLGWHHVTYEQHVAGVPVLAAQLVLLLDPQFAVRYVTSTLVPDATPAEPATLSSADAEAKALGSRPLARQAVATELAILAPRRLFFEEGAPSYGWIVRTDEPDMAYEVFVHAAGGAVRHLHAGREQVRDFELWDNFNNPGIPFPGSLVCDESAGCDPTTLTGTSLSAFNWTDDAYAYWATFGYDGHGNLDHPACATGHMGPVINDPGECGGVNTFTYGSTCTDVSIGTSCMEADVFTHEFGHVFELNYAANCSGIECNPIEEHWADANAMFVSDDVDWYLLFEDSAAGNESAQDPTIYGDNDTYNNLEGFEYQDNGIANKAVYLLRREASEGAASHHGQSVTGIGRTAASNLYYTAMSANYLTDTFFFRKWRTELLAAATAIWGGGSTQYTATDKAFDAVGVWRDLIAIPGTGSTYGTTPAVSDHVVSGQTRFYLFWADTSDTNRINFMHKPWAGAWTAPANFGAFTASGTYPALTRLGGELYAFWSNTGTCAIQYRRIMPDGALTSIVTTPATSCSSPAVTTFDGKIWLFYLSGTSIVYRTYTPGMGGFTAETSAGATATSLPAAVTADASKLYLFWVNASTLRYKTYTVASGWSSNLTVTDRSGATITTDESPGVAEYRDKIHITTTVSGSGGQAWQYLVYDPSVPGFSEVVLHNNWGTSPYVGAMAGHNSDFVLYHVVKGVGATDGWNYRWKNAW